jgi:hypothetical protein
MKRKLFLIIGLVGMLGVFSSCEKEGEKVFILDNVNPPVLGDLPNLTLERANSAAIITFAANPVDPGFQASAEYFLEVDVAGNNFANPMVLYSGPSVGEIKIVAATLNSMLIEKFTPDVATSGNFRVKAVLNVDSGQGAPGSGANPMVFYSETKTANITPFGLPRLNLVGSGLAQMIQSEAGDGVYRGFVKLTPGNAFTLVNPDDGTIYGGQGGNLQVNGPAIAPPNTAGWHILTANLNTNTYSFVEYRIGLVGSATPNGWNTPDQKMDYNIDTKRWVITIDLVVGEIKFRKNDGWAWNLGGVDVNTLVQGGDNLPISSAGNYTISLEIINDLTGRCTIVKN